MAVNLVVKWLKLLKFVSATYNIGFNTFIFLFDATRMLLTSKNDFFPYNANLWNAPKPR